MKQDMQAVSDEWTGKAFLLVDLDAFFASVEQLDHPDWRGKPVIVGGQAGKRGVVSTCSYEARAYGVRSAMPSVTAERLCPDAIWSSAHFDRYHEVSAQILDIMRDESPLLERVSIDEAFLDISPGRFSKESPPQIAERIQRRVDDLGVTCSIGCATSKVVAKIASFQNKPNGLTVVYPGSEPGFLAPMPCRSMPGIGSRSAQRLQEFGITTIGELSTANLDVLRPIFGINAEAMRDRARGIDPREVEVDTETKSVSHELTFSEDLTTREEIEAAIDILASKVGRRLRRKDLAGHTLTLKLRYSDLSRRTAQCSLPANTADETVMIPRAKELVDTIWRTGDAVRLVGVGISGFDDREEQMGLFEESVFEQGSPEIIAAADQVRDRFGEGAVKFGRELKMEGRGTGSAGNNDGEL
ncbi:MAG: DNA polymerase IV [Coriobacteriaceae bacterium]|nr:DNA polymerase IV [Coriobacteriaceae bacterium]